MKSKPFLLFVVVILMAALTGCTLSLARPPASLPTAYVFPTLPPTGTLLAQPVASPTPALPTLTPVSATTALSATPGGTIPDSPSGPYAVILVAPTDVLNIRSAAGAGSPIVGAFAATATNVTRTGPSTYVGSSLWVEVHKPGGGKGWVNAKFLTEYVTPSAFCADGKVTTLIANLDTAITTSNGALFASLVSPTHGADVRLWRYGKVVNYDQEHARWVFESTLEINWGPAPGSGLDTIGSFHVAVLPRLQDVFNASYTLNCNDPGVAAHFSLEPWPNEYANIHYYNVYKPGSPGVDLDWRTWLVGVEYVKGQPYLFSLIHFQWEP